MNEALDWTRGAFKKCGRFICHLAVSDWKVIGPAVGNKDRLQLETRWIDTPRYCAGGGGEGEAIEQGPILFPETLTLTEMVTLDAIFRTNGEFSTHFNSGDWELTCQIWMLILRILAALLCNLRLFAPESRDWAGYSGRYGQFDLQEYMEVSPSLRCLYTGYDSVEDRLLDKSYPHLRALFINKPLSGTTFHNLLKYLVGMEHLRVVHLWEIPDHVNYDDDDWQEGEVRGQSCSQTSAEFMSEAAFDVLPSLPFLTELNIDATYPDLRTMLAKHCKLLQVFRSSEGCETISRLE
ncbi:hypothetical protein BG015_000857 [Linnemannia schmuckeri]|uniref:Uncharacterized protein n=1 Tax=Linnemannia schmuckeri TaxID=64567 RepID=A0A9P5V763_9FUNG|nr:hypothetical protein BG015_000857 [Linnemannia schmuckeri]